MALVPIVPESDFETLDESLKTLYVQNTDTKEYYLDVQDPDRLATGLAAEKQKLADNNQKLVDQLANERKKAADLAAKASEAAKQAKDDDSPDLAAKLADFEAKNASLQESLEAEKANREQIAKQAASSMRNAEIEKVLNRFHMMPSAAANLREATEVVQGEDGSYRVQVVDANGKPVMSAGQHVTLESLVAGWQGDSNYANLFAANGSGGTGAPGRMSGGRGGAKQITRSQWEKLSAAESSEFVGNGGTVIPG